MLTRKNKKTIKFNETYRVLFLFNIIVPSIYILFMKVQLNLFQDALINKAFAILISYKLNMNHV